MTVAELKYRYIHSSRVKGTVSRDFNGIFLILLDSLYVKTVPDHNFFYLAGNLPSPVARTRLGQLFFGKNTLLQIDPHIP
jgi:hypothetical protein